MGLALKDKVDAIVTPDVKRRVAAWWYGVDVESLDWPDETEMEDWADEAPATPSDDDMASAVDVFSQSIKLSEALWGQGFVSPGGAGFIGAWGDQLVLDKDKRTLILGSGLGGQAREISRNAGAGVSGLERFSSLVAVAEDQALEAGMADAVPSEVYDPESVILAEDAFDVVLAKEELTFVQDKGRLLEEVAKSLAPGGRFLFTEYVFAGGGLSAEKLASWFGNLRGTPSLWAEQDYVGKLEALGLEVVVNEEASEPHVRAISHGWQSYRDIVDSIRNGGGSDLEKVAMLKFVAESAEQWTRVVEALSSGELQVRRFVAIKP